MTQRSSTIEENLDKFAYIKLGTFIYQMTSLKEGKKISHRVENTHNTRNWQRTCV